MKSSSLYPFLSLNFDLIFLLIIFIICNNQRSIDQIAYHNFYINVLNYDIKISIYTQQ